MDTSQSISLHAAFAHCASTGSYWLWIVIAFVASIIALYLLTKANNKAEVNSLVKIIIYFAVLVAIGCSIFVRPCSVMVNTSVDAAARGHYLGY
jgi:bacteriorhodopsin